MARTKNGKDGDDALGYLELIIGPMFSGKTSKLIEIYKQCEFCNISVAAINYIGDTRYSETMIASHDMKMIPCIQGSSIGDILNGPNGARNAERLTSSDVILINEGQFFCDIKEHVETWVEQYGKRVYVCGLDGDFERKPIGGLLGLIPLCDKVNKLTSLCSKCKNGTRAIFSYRVTDEKEQIVIGSSNYIPVCRKCYVTMSEMRNE
jgi:thymidine kinase